MFERSHAINQLRSWRHHLSSGTIGYSVSIRDCKKCHSQQSADTCPRELKIREGLVFQNFRYAMLLGHIVEQG